MGWGKGRKKISKADSSLPTFQRVDSVFILPTVFKVLTLTFLLYINTTHGRCQTLDFLIPIILITQLSLPKNCTESHLKEMKCRQWKKLDVRLSNTVHRRGGAKFYQIGGASENPHRESSISERGKDRKVQEYRGGHDACGDTSVCCSAVSVCQCVWSSFHNGFFPLVARFH